MTQIYAPTWGSYSVPVPKAVSQYRISEGKEDEEDLDCLDCVCINYLHTHEMKAQPQKILVYQQNGSGEAKIQGIKKYGGGLFIVEIISIDSPLPLFVDDTTVYLPRDICADLVLDFMKHPDLSYDLAAACHQRNIPVVASGKKSPVKGVLNPPT